MEISVYLQGQDHASSVPVHRSTRTMMKLVLAAELAERIGQNAIRLTTGLSWREVKAFARLAISRKRLDMAIDLPIREYPLNEACLNDEFQRCMTYPLVLARDQRSPWANWADLF